MVNNLLSGEQVSCPFLMNTFHSHVCLPCGLCIQTSNVEVKAATGSNETSNSNSGFMVTFHEAPSRQFESLAQFVASEDHSDSLLYYFDNQEDWKFKAAAIIGGSELVLGTVSARESCVQCV